jgi:hypothetical protein
MADDDDEAEEAPAVELGTGESVEGAPLARVASRLTWPKTASRIRELEGDSTVRTPAGPQTLADVLDDVETTYFDSRQEFLDDVTSAVGTGPVGTAD